jgi:hypothetical protein
MTLAATSFHATSSFFWRYRNVLSFCPETYSPWQWYIHYRIAQVLVLRYPSSPDRVVHHAAGQEVNLNRAALNLNAIKHRISGSCLNSCSVLPENAKLKLAASEPGETRGSSRARGAFAWPLLKTLFHHQFITAIDPGRPANLPISSPLIKSPSSILFRMFSRSVTRVAAQSAQAARQARFVSTNGMLKLYNTRPLPLNIHTNDNMHSLLSCAEFHHGPACRPSPQQRPHPEHHAQPVLQQHGPQHHPVPRRRR